LQCFKSKTQLYILTVTLLFHPQGLWDKNCEAVPDSGGESVTEDAGEDDYTSSPPEDEAPIDEGVASPSKSPLEGKIHEPQTSGSEDELGDAEAEDSAPKRKQGAIAKKPLKKQKTASNLVQTKLTSVVKPAPSKTAPTKAATAKDSIVELSESSDESDDPPRVKG
jgi:hypothetical protein